MYRFAVVTLCLCHIVGAETFLIGGWGAERLYQADSCGINTTQFWCLPNSVEDLLNTAEILKMDVILGNAMLWPWNANHSITRMARGQWARYEAEEEGFEHQLGAAVDSTSWAVCGDTTGWLQYNLWTDEQSQFWDDLVVYNALFRLKTDDVVNTEPLCRLSVRRKTDDGFVILAENSLAQVDFAQAGTWEEFKLQFSAERYDYLKIDCAIWYMGTNDSLYSDRVDIIDFVADSLRQGYYDSMIDTIVLYYNSKSALFRYFLWDEPQTDQYWSSKEMSEKLTTFEPLIPGCQCFSNWAVIDDYVDSVDLGELLVDYYPLYGNTNRIFERVPEDDGQEFQECLDKMCDEILDEIRSTIIDHPEKKFWFIPQAFGHALSDYDQTWKPEWNDGPPDLSDEGWWREPTARELRCMVWLALAYGAKGIHYYRYHPCFEVYLLKQFDPVYSDSHWITGLTAPPPDDTIKRPLWYTVQRINEELEAIGDQLLVLMSESAFRSDNIPAGSFIKSVGNPQSSTLLQIGTFREANTNNPFFIIVNRHCLPAETLLYVDVRMKVPVPYLYDCYSTDTIYPNNPGSKQSCFTIGFEPGQGRLFRVVREDTDYGYQRTVDDISLPRLIMDVQTYPTGKDIGIIIHDLERHIAYSDVLTLKVYDAMGGLIKTFTNLKNQMMWDGSDNTGRNVPAGVYFVRLATTDNSETKKVIIFR